MQIFANAARAKLASTLLVGGTSLTLETGGGALFPALTAGNTFMAVLQDSTGYEIVECSSISGDVLQIVRARYGTTAREFAAGSICGIRPLAEDMDAAINKRVQQTSSSGSAILPSGTTAQRVVDQAAIRYNTTTGRHEVYSVAEAGWRDIALSGYIQSRTEFTATAAQTVFTTAYTPGFVWVQINGRDLGSADFTATNGTSITLTVGANLGDLVTVVKSVGASLANAVAKSGDTMTGPLNVPNGATGSNAINASDVDGKLSTKVDKVNGKDLSTNDYTTAEKNKLAAIPTLGSAAVAALVGTVSQSGGVANGAVMQRGSNANGEFVRLADGTQWCWREFAGTITTSIGYLSGFLSTQHNLPFPAAFVSAPDTHMQLIYAAAPAPLQVYVAALDVNNWSNHWYSATNGNVNARAFFTAKGRWY